MDNGLEICQNLSDSFNLLVFFSPLKHPGHTPRKAKKILLGKPTIYGACSVISLRFWPLNNPILKVSAKIEKQDDLNTTKKSN